MNTLEKIDLIHGKTLKEVGWECIGSYMIRSRKILAVYKIPPIVFPKIYVEHYILREIKKIHEDKPAFVGVEFEYTLDGKVLVIFKGCLPSIYHINCNINCSSISICIEEDIDDSQVASKLKQLPNVFYYIVNFPNISYLTHGRKFRITDKCPASYRRGSCNNYCFVHSIKNGSIKVNGEYDLMART